MTSLHVGLGIGAATCVVLFFLGLDFLRHIRKRKRSRRYQKQRRLLETGFCGTPVRPSPFQQFLSASTLLKTVSQHHAAAPDENTCHVNNGFVAEEDEINMASQNTVMTSSVGSGRRKSKKAKQKRLKVRPGSTMTSHNDNGFADLESSEGSVRDGRRNRLEHLTQPRLSAYDVTSSSSSVTPYWRDADTSNPSNGQTVSSSNAHLTIRGKASHLPLSDVTALKGGVFSPYTRSFDYMQQADTGYTGNDGSFENIREGSLPHGEVPLFSITSPQNAQEKSAVNTKNKSLTSGATIQLHTRSVTSL